MLGFAGGGAATWRAAAGQIKWHKKSAAPKTPLRKINGLEI